MESSNLIPVRPVLPVAPYIGGKRNLSARLVDLIGTIDHELYAEPFVGMGGVFFRRDRRPRTEVINDVSGDVTTLFRILQRHYQSFLEELRWRLSSRAEFERLMIENPASLTDLERSARFLYLQRLSFGGKVSGRNFGVSRTASARFDLTKLVPMLEAVHERLAGVVIERMSYEEFIARYDRPGALFYLDPPYYDCEDDYGPDVFSRSDFEALRSLLSTIKGSFVMSINDRPEVREIYAAFDIQPVDLSYRISGAATKARELIIRGPR